MKFRIENTYFKWGITIFSSVSACIILFFLIYRSQGLGYNLSIFISIITPFIYGFVIAYLLTPAYNFFLRRTNVSLSPFIRDKRKLIIFSKSFSTAITLILTLTVIVGLVSMVLPQLTESVLGIVNTFPSNADGLTNWVVNTFKLSNKTAEFINNNIVTNMTNWFMDNLVPSMSEVMSGVSTGLISVLLILKNLLLGLIICIYFLNGKEMFAAQTKKIIFAILKKERAEFVIHESKFINRTFSGFIIGKIVDSIIIGIICFIGLTIMKMPYTLLISVIVGVTNVIPFFGPFIGAIPSTIIILLESPIQALYFVIFIQILQLADGNFIGPKILGDSTGIPSFWVIFAILLGGGLFGFVGMIIGIPIFAVIYAYVGRYVRFKLEQKNLPSDTVNYKDISHYTIKKPSKKGVK